MRELRTLSRRHFLLGLGGSLLVGAAYPMRQLWRPRLAPLNLNGIFLTPLRFAGVEKRYAISVVDFDRNRQEIIPIPDIELPHLCLTHRSNPRRVFIVPKTGPRFAVVDLLEGRVTQTLDMFSETLNFRGHGLVSDDGNTLFMTVGEKGREGFISVRDAHSLAELGRIYTNGMSPHDFTRIQHGKSFAVVNMYAKKGSAILSRGSLSILDIDGGKVLETVPCPVDNSLLTHVAANSSDELVITAIDPSGNMPPGINTYSTNKVLPAPSFIFTKSGRLEPLNAPEISDFQRYSMAIGFSSDEKSAIILHSAGQRLSVWDVARHTLIGQIATPDFPYGLVRVSDNTFLVSLLTGDCLVVNLKKLYEPTLQSNCIATSKKKDMRVLGHFSHIEVKQV